MSETKEIMDYLAENFDTEKIKNEGVFVRTTNKKRAKVGDIVGTKTGDGHLQMWAGKKLHHNHRLVFLQIFGRWPVGEIDHINKDKEDNHPVNLREVTRQQNAQNMKRYKTNKSGQSGVSFITTIGYWKVSIKRPDGKLIQKYFHHKQDAISCARAKYAEFGYHPGHGGEK